MESCPDVCVLMQNSCLIKNLAASVCEWAKACSANQGYSGVLIIFPLGMPQLEALL